MSKGLQQNAEANEQVGKRPHIGLFVICAVLWIAIDRASKVFFESSYVVGQTSPDFGPVRFCLVHNTGAAWGMFSNSTFVLAVFSLAVCALIVAFFVLHQRVFGFRASFVETLGASLICAGGIGNAIDRLSQAFVTDFIQFTFIDFPVFNVADIGVTCGIVILILGYIIASRAYERGLGGDAREDEGRLGAADGSEKDGTDA